MNFKTLLALSFLGITLSTAIGQEDTNSDKHSENYKDFKNSWSVGLGVNALYDAGKQGEDFNISDDIVFCNPYALSLEYYANNKFSFDFMFSTNKFKEGKLIDDTGYILEDHEANYFAIDLAVKLYFRDWFNTYTFDPYILGGGGYSFTGNYKAVPKDITTIPEYVTIDTDGNMVVPSIWNFTYNAGAGFNIWFSDTWGLNAEATFKWGIERDDFVIGPNSISNQGQFMLGAVFLIND